MRMRMRMLTAHRIVGVVVGVGMAFLALVFVGVIGLLTLADGSQHRARGDQVV